MLLARRILGDAGEPRFAGKRVERLPVDAASAVRRRLRGRTDAGTDVAVDLERGAYLRHGAVLSDEGDFIVAVERTAEDALVVRLTADSCAARVAAAARIAHAFGNQHVPVEVARDELRVPITTSPEVAMATVAHEAAEGVELTVEPVRLGCTEPLLRSMHAH
jgi:urease accessory protein